MRVETGDQPLSKRPEQPKERRQEERVSYYRYYLEDHPFLGPVVVLLLGGLCLFMASGTTILRDATIGGEASRTALESFNTALAWGVAMTLSMMGLAFIFLLVNLVDVGVRKARRRAAVCPRCGLKEERGKMRFAREPVRGVDWESVTCPQCGNEWHERR